LLGEYPVATVVDEQHTRELLLKSWEKLTSISYRAAPGTGVQLRRGSNNSWASTRSRRLVWVADGHPQRNDRTAERAPSWFSASIGVTAQKYVPSARVAGGM
jgi:hypothetical protein